MISIPCPSPKDSDLGAPETDDWGGPSLVVHAVCDARMAAQGVHHYLSGAGRR